MNIIDNGTKRAYGDTETADTNTIQSQISEIQHEPSDLDNEITARKAADTGLQTNINTEVTRAKAAEAAIVQGRRWQVVTDDNGTVWDNFTIDTPVFTNQPTYNLGSYTSLENAGVALNTEYFPIFTDSTGTALSDTANTFYLTKTYNTASDIIPVLFTLTGLATGNSGTLSGYTSVSFKNVDGTWKMRSETVSSLSFTYADFGKYPIRFTGMLLNSQKNSIGNTTLFGISLFNEKFANKAYSNSNIFLFNSLNYMVSTEPFSAYHKPIASVYSSAPSESSIGVYKMEFEMISPWMLKGFCEFESGKTSTKGLNGNNYGMITTNIIDKSQTALDFPAEFKITTNYIGNQYMLFRNGSTFKIEELR